MDFVRHISLVFVSIFFALVSCEENTAFIGADVMPGHDDISTSQAVFTVNSKSFKVDSVLANTNECLLGCIVDPETRAKTKSGFLAQFHMMENFKFPDRKDMLTDSEGRVVADSCIIRIFFDDYYGDSLVTMKLYVNELDTNKVLKENIPYYSNLNPKDYINSQSIANTSLAYSVKDFTRPDSVTDGGSYLRSIVVKLAPEYGSYILNKYYENPEFFRNSYQFIHHVCPGFNFETVGSIGSMIKVDVAALDVYFKYHTKDVTGKDTIIDGMHRMAATEEVIQNTHVENNLPDWMFEESSEYTFLKSPTGIFTELTLPVETVVAGGHESDTINSAKLTIRNFHNKVESDFHLNPPSSVLLVRKADMFAFFERNALPDGKDSFVASYDGIYNAYQFTNIGQLLTNMKLEREKGAGVVRGESEQQRAVKFTKWENDNPDWNKVVLIPVNAEYSTTTNIYGSSSQTLLRVRNLFDLSSAKLEGGISNSLQLHVIYSSFNK